MLSIKHWHETFENSDTRKRKRLGWFLCPSGVDSCGYLELMQHGAAGVMAYGVFQIICQWSATCLPPIRGNLCRNSGEELTIRQLSMLLRVEVDVLEPAIELLLRPEIGWLIKTQGSEQRQTETGRNLPPTADVLPPISRFVKGEGEGEGEGEDSRPDSRSPDMETAHFIWNLIQDLQPDRTLPDFQKWANTIRLMRERDNRSDSQIRQLFSWANRDPFWKTNILSPDKLRAKWDDLALKSKVSGGGVDIDAERVFQPIRAKYQPDVKDTTVIQRLLAPSEFQAVSKVGLLRIADSRPGDKALAAAYRAALNGAAK